MENLELDTNNRCFIIERDLYNEYEGFTDKNCLFGVDINTRCIYSFQRRRTE